MYSFANDGRFLSRTSLHDGSGAGAASAGRSLAAVAFTVAAAAALVFGLAGTADATQSDEGTASDRLTREAGPGSDLEAASLEAASLEAASLEAAPLEAVSPEAVPVQEAGRAGPEVFLSLGGGLRVPSGGDFSQVATQEPLPPSLFRGETSYSYGQSFQLDVNGGVMITPPVGVGVGFGRSSTEAAADLTLTFPNTVWLGVVNDAETEQITTRPLGRTESSVHVSGIFRVPVEGPVSVSFLGGPSRVGVDQEIAVDGEAVFNEARMLLLAPDFFDLLSAEVEEASASAWGFHVGADVSYFFTETVGFGTLLRFSRATVELENGLQSTVDGSTMTEEHTVGGFQAVAGLRVRF